MHKSQDRNHDDNICDIVLVDDEDDVLDTIGPFLKAKYKVKTFKSGTNAIEYIRNCKVRLLITDLRMPGLNGFMLIDEAKLLHPELKIILISGFIDTNSATERELYRKYTPWCLSKPFSLADIGRLVDGVINGSRITDGATNTIENNKTDSSQQ